MAAAISSSDDPSSDGRFSDAFDDSDESDAESDCNVFEIPGKDASPAEMQKVSLSTDTWFSRTKAFLIRLLNPRIWLYPSCE